MKRDLWRIVFDYLLLLYGYLLLIAIVYLAREIALGLVEEKSSYGLSPLLIVVSLMADRWATWAFPKRGVREDGDGNTSTGNFHGQQLPVAGPDKDPVSKNP